MKRITDQDVKQGATLFLARVLARDPARLAKAGTLVERRLREWGIAAPVGSASGLR